MTSWSPLQQSLIIAIRPHAQHNLQLAQVRMAPLSRSLCRDALGDDIDRGEPPPTTFRHPRAQLDLF
jgi:hypothetical protein